jgi:hypothetical protein
MRAQQYSPIVLQSQLNGPRQLQSQLNGPIELLAQVDVFVPFIMEAARSWISRSQVIVCI